MNEVMYLKNVETGAVFMYSALLHKKAGMVPCNAKGEVSAELDQASATLKAATVSEFKKKSRSMTVEMKPAVETGKVAEAPGAKSK